MVEYSNLEPNIITDIQTLKINIQAVISIILLNNGSSDNKTMIWKKINGKSF